MFYPSRRGVCDVVRYSMRALIVSVLVAATNQIAHGQTSFAPVVTLAASGISNTVATLNGRVTPGGLATAAWFEWGLYDGLNTNTTASVALSGTTSIVMSTNISGLTPGFVYHYCVVASNALGVMRGGSVAFGSPVVNGAVFPTTECHTVFTNSTVTAFGMPINIDGGDLFMMVLKNDGRCVGWEYNNNGESTPPPGLSNVVAMVSGTSHTLALRSDGTVVAWGAANSGRTAVPVGLSNVVGVAGGNLHSLVVKSDGTVVTWGGSDYGQTVIPAGLSNVVAVAAGDSHSLALRCDGTVAGWGRVNQTNIPAGLSNVVAISAGGNLCMALKSDGKVVVWGSAPAVPNGLSNVVAIAAGSFDCLALRRDNSVVQWGLMQSDPTIPTLTNVVAIGAGRTHGIASRNNGTVVVWGDGTYGQTNIPPGLSSLPVTTIGSVNTNTPGSYPVSYTFTNVFGGPASASGSVAVVDTAPPVITMLGSNPLTNLANVAFNDPGATATDACAGNRPVSTNKAVNVNVPGTYTVTYTSTDNYTNTANAVRTVVVIGPPTFGGLGAIVVGTNAVTGARTVQFTAAVNPNGVEAVVNFQYGLTTAYGGINGPITLPASLNTSNLIVTISGFSPGIPYHWNVTGTSGAGNASAPDQTFTIGASIGSGIHGDLNSDGIVSLSELNAVSGAYATNSLWLYLTNVAAVPGGTNVTFALNEPAGGGYSVQFSTNLANWLPLGTARPRFLFTDTNAPANPLRYYRLVYP
jgi:hypothetical protein